MTFPRSYVSLPGRRKKWPPLAAISYDWKKTRQRLSLVLPGGARGDSSGPARNHQTQKRTRQIRPGRSGAFTVGDRTDDG
eukprot:gene25876-biopygen11104